MQVICWRGTRPYERRRTRCGVRSGSPETAGTGPALPRMRAWKPSGSCNLSEAWALVRLILKNFSSFIHASSGQKTDRRRAMVPPSPLGFGAEAAGDDVKLGAVLAAGR